MRPTCFFFIMPLHPWQYHHLALGNRKFRGERISSLQRAVREIMGEDWNVRMRSGVTNVVDVYTDVPQDHQLDLELNAMAVLWESRKEWQSVRRLQYSRSTSTWYCPWAKIVSMRKTLGAPHPIDFSLESPGCNDLIGSRVNLKEKLQLMWQHNPPVTPTAPYVQPLRRKKKTFEKLGTLGFWTSTTSWKGPFCPIPSKNHFLIFATTYRRCFPALATHGDPRRPKFAGRRPKKAGS